MKIETTQEMPADEAEQAKEFWFSTEFQRKQYPKNLPRYVVLLRDAISAMRPASVLEFGCNAGRNIQLLSTVLGPAVRLKGVDINAASVEFGRKEWNLDLEMSDESTLSKLPDGAFDVVFTVSVLDHIPHVSAIVSDLVRVAARYIILFEPCADTAGRVNAFEDSAGEMSAATPFSYIHRYPDLLADEPVVLIGERPEPPYKTNLGPLYKFMIYRKTQLLGRIRNRRSDQAILGVLSAD